MDNTNLLDSNLSDSKNTSSDGDPTGDIPNGYHPSDGDPTGDSPNGYHPSDGEPFGYHTLSYMRSHSSEEEVEEYKHILIQENTLVLINAFADSIEGIDTLIELYSTYKCDKSIVYENLSNIPNKTLEYILRNQGIEVLAHFKELFVDKSKYMSSETFYYITTSINTRLELIKYIAKDFFSSSSNDNPTFFIKTLLTMSRKFNRHDIVKFMFKEYPNQTIEAVLFLSNMNVEYRQNFISSLKESLISS